MLLRMPLSPVQAGCEMSYLARSGGLLATRAPREQLLGSHLVQILRSRSLAAEAAVDVNVAHEQLIASPLTAKSWPTMPTPRCSSCSNRAKGATHPTAKDGPDILIRQKVQRGWLHQVLGIWTDTSSRFIFRWSHQFQMNHFNARLQTFCLQPCAKITQR